MDIDYLLFLQEFRETGGQWLAPVMHLISQIALYGLMLIPILIFWNAGREEGYWHLLNLGLTDYVNNLIKLTVCVYRPWIRDSRVIPWGNAKDTATGYSFPSGHTSTAAAVLGSVGIRQRKKRIWLTVLSLFLAVLVGFSRNYLGVHTPQDVLVALAEAAAVIAFNTWLFSRLRGNERRQDLWTAAGFVILAASLVYIHLKPYPADAAEGGALLVDPQTMMNDMYSSVGLLLGFLTGSLWERKIIRFDPAGSAKERLIRSAVGVVITLVIYVGLRKLGAGLIGKRASNLISMMLLALFVTGVYPWCIMKRKARKAGR